VQAGDRDGVLEPQVAPPAVGGRFAEVAGHEHAFDPLDQGAQLVVVLRRVEQQDERRELPHPLVPLGLLAGVFPAGCAAVGEGLALLVCGVFGEGFDLGGQGGDVGLEVFEVLEQADGHLEVGDVGVIGHRGRPSSLRTRRRRAW
jgi:hypothetical protein